MTPTLTDLQRQLAKADEIELTLTRELALAKHRLYTHQEAKAILVQRLADARAEEKGTSHAL